VHEFRPNSGGDGQYVGGAGVDLELVVETEAPAIANVAGDGLRHGARGMLAGSDGAPHYYLIRRPGEPAVALHSKMEGVPVPAGSAFEVHSGGGGGWGAPEKRTSVARSRDAENELVTTTSK
jgi:N-methylhydantoinase B